MAASRTLGVFVGGTQRSDPTTGAQVFTLDVADLDAGEIRRIPLGFLAHGFTTDPTRPHLAVVTEKKGPGAALVDLREGRAVGLLKTRAGRAFYGHGSYSAAGDVVYVVETELATRGGLLSVRDAKTFAVLEEFPTFGASPHDCALVDEGKTLVVTNGGGPEGSPELPCVTVVDVATRKLIDKILIPASHLNAGHLAVAEGDLAVSSAPREGLPERESLGGLSLRPAGEACKTVDDPIASRMRGESLSVCFFDREAPSGGRVRIAAVTNPWGNLLTFWDLRARRLVLAMDLELPRGVAMTTEGHHLLVSYGARATLLRIDTRTLEPLADEHLGDARFSGSHLYRWTAADSSA